MTQQPSAVYTERLWPSVMFFVALLLIIPALSVLFTPYSLQAGVIAGIVAYIAVCSLFLVWSRKIEVRDGVFTAGRAHIDVNLLGKVETLDPQELKIAIGRRLDARAYLCVTGWVHTGIKVEVTDPADNTPYWVVTTRRPQTLAKALTSAKLVGESSAE